MSIAYPLPRDTRQAPDYLANGTNVAFNAPFRVIDARDLMVLVALPGTPTTFTVKQLNTDYTVSGINNVSGATVTFNVPPVLNATIRILGHRVPSRLTSVTNEGVIQSTPLENEFDTVELTMQELRRDIDATGSLTPGRPGPPAWLPLAPWAANTAYAIGPPASLVSYAGGTYVCVAVHTSGTVFDGSKWSFVAGSGPAGPQGAPGPVGPAGPQGLQGPLGPQGAAGPVGATGPQGPAAWMAVANWAPSTAYTVGPPASLVNYQGGLYACATSHTSGATFDPAKWTWISGTGPVGPQGPAGPAGATGAAGAPGAAGPQGVQGVQGVPGLQGPVGAAGAQGPQGPVGPQGPAGVAYGPIDNVVIGGTTPAAGSFTSLNGGQLAGQRNRIINGDMRIDQWHNHASFGMTAAAIYPVADRYSFYQNVAKFNYVYSPVTGGPPGFPNYAQVATTATPYTPAAGDAFFTYHRVEGENVQDLQWGTPQALPVTLSFWAATTNAGTYSGALQNGAGNRSYPFTFVLPANNWTKIAITIPGDTTGTWAIDNTIGIGICFDMGCGSTSRGPANAWGGTAYNGVTGTASLVSQATASFNLTGLQLEPGSVATPFERRLYGTELALCQRYYERSAPSIRGYLPVANNVLDCTVYCVPKRAAPTTALITAGTRSNVSSVALYYAGNFNTLRLEASAAAVGDTYVLNDLWEISAEL